MGFGIRLHVWGERACFTRPEMKVERVSYDVMTPSAARGILEAVHWKPSIRWIVDRIHVLRPIRFQSLRRNEVGAKISASLSRRAMRSGSLASVGLSIENNRQQRATMLLVDVAYVIEGHFEMAARAAIGDTPAKHVSIFNRRATAGQCFHRPYLGTREFPADFALLPEGATVPLSTLPEDQRNRDLGWMLHDIDYGTTATPCFFQARLIDGVLDVQHCLLGDSAA